MTRPLLWAFIGSVTSTLSILLFTLFLGSAASSIELRHSTEKSLVLMGHRITVGYAVSPNEPTEGATFNPYRLDADTRALFAHAAGAELSCVVVP